MAQDQGVFTNIDAFVKFLNDHGETEGSVIAASLGVSERNVEEWAKILERSNIAKITYRMDKMFIAPVEKEEAVSAELKQISEVKRAIVKREIDVQLVDLGGLTKKIDELNRAVSKSEGVLNSNAGKVKEALEKIERIRKHAEDSFGKIRGRKDELERFSQELDGMIKSLSQGPGTLSVTQNKNNVNIAIEELKAKIQTLEQGNSDLVKNYEKGVKEGRERIIEFSKNAKGEIAALKGLLSDERKSLVDYDKTFKNYLADSAKAKQMVERNKAVLSGRMKEVRKEIDDAYEAAEKEVGEVGSVLSNAREGLAGFDEIKTKLDGIKKEIDDAEARIGEIRGQIETLSRRLKESAVSKGKMKEEEKQAVVEKINSETKNTAERIKNASDKMNSIKGKIDDLAK